jgi:hypothetical protein
MEIKTYVLPRHAAAALGIDPGALDLPRCGYGFSGDALWIDPRFQEIRRRRQAVALQMAEHRVDAELHRTPRTPEEVKTMKRRERKRARKARLKAMRASVV